MASNKKNKVPNFSEKFQTVDEKLVSLLVKCGNGEHLDNLSLSEKDELWKTMLSLLENKIPNVKTDTENNDIAVVNDLLDMIYYLLSNHLNILENSIEFFKIIHYMNKECWENLNEKVVNHLSKVFELWMTKVESGLHEGLEYFVLKHLFSLCLVEKPLVSDLQRLNAIRKHVTTAPFEKKVPTLKPRVYKLLQSLPVLNSEHGQRFLAQILTLSYKLMSDLHKTILLELETSNKKKSVCYGKIYVQAWYGASDEFKTQLEKDCFQDLAEKFLKEKRDSLSLSKCAENLINLMEVWHQERKKKHSNFIKMITDTYEPLLGKYLESEFNVLRCNAAELFFKAFPMQRPGDNVLEAERQFNTQVDTMTTLGKDDCHIVRIIAIREVCNILSVYWNMCGPTQIQALLTMVSQSSRDASSADVRRTVFVSFQSLLNSPQSTEYLKQILPGMADCLHDVNQRVRIAFIQLLISIKEMKDPNFKFTDVASQYHLFYRIMEDNINVGQCVVRLLLSLYYTPSMQVVEWTKRFIYMVKTYNAAYRNFFLYSGKMLKFEQALTIMTELMKLLGNYVLLKLTTEDEEEPEQPKKPVRSRKKRGSKKTPLTEAGNRKEELNVEEKKVPKDCALDDPMVVTGLFDIITILWVLHDNKLQLPENEDSKKELYETYGKYAQPFIVYYKDTGQFLSVLSLSGNLPASLLRSYSITLPGYCMKELQNLRLDNCRSSSEKLLPMLGALTKWSRGGDVLEQIQLWLEAAFATQRKDLSILSRRKVHITEAVQPTSVVAINLLDIMMQVDHIQNCLLRKNHLQLVELWKTMADVLPLIKSRLDNGEPFEEEQLSDNFLKLCFRRYVKLIPMLDENRLKKLEDQAVEEEDGFQVEEEVSRVLSWLEDNIYTLLLQEEVEQEDLELVCSLINDSLMLADNLITLHMVHTQLYLKVGQFVLRLLNTRHGLWFIHAATRLTTVLSNTGKVLYSEKDDLHIFSAIVPNLLCSILKVLSARDSLTETLPHLEEHLPAIKTHLSKVLHAYSDNLRSKTTYKKCLREYQMVAGMFVKTMIKLMCQEFPLEDNTIPSFSSLSHFSHLLATLLAVFQCRKIFGPMFLMTLESAMADMDSKSLVAAVLLINFFSKTDKNLKEAELLKVLNTATQCLNKLTLRRRSTFEEAKRRKTLEYTSGMEVEVEASQGQESTQGNTQNTWPSNAATIQGTRDTTTDLTDDFLACGTGLVKMVQDYVRKQTDDIEAQPTPTQPQEHL